MAQEYSIDEVSAHTAATDCWIVINGLVFDITKFLEDHPGGSEILLEHAGKDATQEFDDIGHSAQAKEQLKKYLIGILSKSKGRRGSGEGDDTDPLAKFFEVVRTGDRAELEKALKEAQAQGLDVNSTDEAGRSALFIAVQSDRNEIVRHLLGLLNADATHMLAGGISPAHIAAEVGNKEMLATLVSSGVEYTADKYGRTPLHFAAEQNKAEVAQVILNEKLDTVDVTDDRGWTALWVAALRGHQDTVQALLDFSADPNVADRSEWPPLFAATMKGHLEVVKKLHTRGADIHHLDANEQNALHIAAFYGQANVAEYLISQGVNLQAKDKDGKTPIGLAISKKKSNMYDVLTADTSQKISADAPKTVEEIRALLSNAAEFDRVAKTCLEATRDPSGIVHRNTFVDKFKAWIGADLAGKVVSFQTHFNPYDPDRSGTISDSDFPDFLRRVFKEIAGK